MTGTYTDDTLGGSSSVQERDRAKGEIGEAYRVKETDSVEFALGMRLIHNREHVFSCSLRAPEDLSTSFTALAKLSKAQKITIEVTVQFLSFFDNKQNKIKNDMPAHVEVYAGTQLVAHVLNELRITVENIFRKSLYATKLLSAETNANFSNERVDFNVMNARTAYVLAGSEVMTRASGTLEDLLLELHLHMHVPAGPLPVEDNSQEDTRSLLYDTFLVVPLLPSGAFYQERKFSGNAEPGQNEQDFIGCVVDTFAHHVVDESNGDYMLADIQGLISSDKSSILLFDPQAHTKAGGLGAWDSGTEEIKKFCKEHKCNIYCNKLHLRDLSKPFPSRPW
ncbi:hypothetical protein D9757_004414 [Collybiopsis confluens]|uniref:Alpha-type protein kinase domain-containing protein n=1 Tax=Collybiopsis confluens TaxID=2823264 RepID=A0A8H5HWK8_9AGAR|nr:hypothetical protein D9757_004414 [Collybiopsis confluens]